MKYYTFEISTANGATAKAVAEYSILKNAVSAHHQTMASALANPNCTEVLSMVVNSAGGIHTNEHWKAEEANADGDDIQ